MEKLISAFWSVLELFAQLLFWKAFFQPKVQKREYLMAVVAIWMLNQLYINRGLPSELITGLTLLLYVVVSCLINEGKWYQHILAVFAVTGMSGIIDTIFLYGVSSVIGISVSELAWKKFLYVVVVTSGKLFLLLVAWMLYRFPVFRRTQSLQGRWLFLSLLFPITSTATLLLIFNNFKNEADISIGIVFFCAVLAIANIAILYAIGLVQDSTERLKENALLSQQMEIQTDNIVALEKSYRAQRKATHEFKNQLQAISDLLTLGEIDEAKKYIQTIQGQQTTRIFCVNSHHPIIDAVLNHKYQTAKEYGIDVQVQVNDLSAISIETNQLVVLLSNLLDNAIEGCCRVAGERALYCSMVASDVLQLSVRNTSLPVKIWNNTIATSKKSKINHGYGLSQVHSILNQLRAEYAFDYQDGWFTFVAEIPL
mgnify:FL=1